MYLQLPVELKFVFFLEGIQKNIKRIVLVSCAFATLQTVVFMRLPLCGCVDCVAVCFVGCFYF